MKILVISDSHGDSGAILRAYARETNIAMVIHLGDGERDILSLRPALGTTPLLAVCGNCDFGSALPDTVCTTEGGKTILCTHGHKMLVKYGMTVLRERAIDAHADIALYGHTHVPVQIFEDGIYYCNPGSIRQGHYAVLEIVPDGIMWLPKNIY